MKPKLALVVLVPLLLSAGQAQEAKKAEPKQLVKEVLVKAAEFDDIGAILHIDRWSGHVTLKDPCKDYVWMEVEFYRNGQKLPKTFASGKMKRSDGVSKIEFVMQALDTDYLPVAGSKKNHCRLLFGTKSGNGIASRPHDVDKALFDFSQVSGRAIFSAAASSEGKIPLFWFVSKTNDMISTDTVEGVLKTNKTGDLAIFYLRVSKQV